MFVKLNSKSQITIPQSIVNSMNLAEGDQFKIFEENGKIILVPIAIYSDNTLQKLKNSVDEINELIEKDKQPIFSSIESLFEDLDK